MPSATLSQGWVDRLGAAGMAGTYYPPGAVLEVDQATWWGLEESGYLTTLPAAAPPAPGTAAVVQDDGTVQYVDVVTQAELDAYEPEAGTVDPGEAAARVLGDLDLRSWAGRSITPSRTELAAVVKGNLESFVKWCNQYDVPGVIGEVGVPHNYDGPDGLSPLGEPIHKNGAAIPAVVSSGPWAQELEYLMRYCEEAQLDALPYKGLPVILWESRESSDTSMGLYGPDPSSNNAGPLAYSYPIAPVLESHITAWSFQGLAAWRGLSLRAGDIGFFDTNVLSRGPDTQVFNVGAGMAKGTEYNYGREATWQFLGRRGVRIVRLPFRLERTVDAATVTLRESEWLRIDQALGWALATGVKVQLDMHQRGSWYIDNGAGVLYRHSLGIGDGGVNGAAGPIVFTQAAFVSIWQQIAARYGPGGPHNDLHGAIAGYELMNEPLLYQPGNANGDLTNASRDIYVAASRAAGRAIRAIDPAVFLTVQAYGGGSSASDYWLWHSTGPWMTQADGSLDPHTYYAMHTYMDESGSGVYGIAHDQVRRARASQGYTAELAGRVLGAEAVPMGNLREYDLLTGQGGVPALGNNVLTTVYTAPADKVVVLANAHWLATGAGTMNVYVRPPGNAAAATAAWERWRPTLANGGDTTLGPGPILLEPGASLDVLSSIAGSGFSCTVHELPISDTTRTLKVVSALGMAGGADVLLYTCPTAAANPPNGKKARVASAGTGAVTGHGWAGFNGNAAAATCQLKVRKAGGAVTARGGALSTAATSHSMGPLLAGIGAFPGVPTPVWEVALDPGDELWLRPSAGPYQAWCLIVETG